MNIEITNETQCPLDITSQELKTFAYTNDVNEDPKQSVFYTKKGINDKLGANNGIATLDSNGKVPAAQLPNSIMQYQGNWDASTNTPALTNGAGNADTAIGDVYKSTSAGTVNFGAGNITFQIGDFVILNASKVWERSDEASDKVAKSGDTMTGTLNLNSQSSTVAPINITAGAKKITPVLGDVENDGQTLLYSDSGATRIGNSGVIYSAGAAQQIVNSTTETTLFSSTAYKTTPNIREISANSFKTGKAIRIKMSGVISTGSPTTSATLRLKVDGVTIATVAEPLSNNMTNYYFDKEITIICRTTGINGTGIYQGRSQLCSATGTNFAILPVTTTTPFTLNTTQANVVDLTFQWTAASTGNNIIVSTATIEILG